MHQILLIMRYDGSAYHGWQIQQNADTVQGTLQKAISQITQEDIHVIGCGRTDTGVHAEIYAASFLTNSRIPTEKFPAALNSMLPYDISIISAHDISNDFHPIRSCTRKEYTYTIYSSPSRDPFLHGRALHITHKLDLDKIRLAAQQFIGTHDFSSMRSLGTDVSSTVRTVYNYDIVENGNTVKFITSANGFLYNMARTMAGTLLHVSSGKIEPTSISDILNSGDRNLAGPTAPACGLALTRLWYNDFTDLKELSYVR